MQLWYEPPPPPPPLYSLWEEIDDHTARLKVSYTFRTFRKMNKAKQNQGATVQVPSES